MPPVVKRDDPSHGNGDLRIYFRNEAPSAQEAIYLRKFYAATLTQMWRNGMIELVDPPSDGLPPYPPVVNGYSFIRQRLPMLTLSALDIIQLNNKDE